MADYTVYIDESGDLGHQVGTQWFVLSAVIVKKSDEAAIRATIKRLKSELKIDEIHFRKIKDFYKRIYIASELSNEPFVYMNILVDTTLFDPGKIPTALIAYNFVCKYLLQRVSWYLEDIDSSADLVLSARGTDRDNELITYIQEKLLPYPKNSISSEAFEKISAKTAASWDLLQLADVCATSTYYAHETNNYGFLVPCFSRILSDHLYHRNGRVDGYGLKYFQPEMHPDWEKMRNQALCAKKEKTPGTTTT